MGGVFVIEALSVIIQIISFRLFGKRFFLIAPIHHHFEKKGVVESKIVVRFWIVSILLSLFAIATLKIRLDEKEITYLRNGCNRYGAN